MDGKVPRGKLTSRFVSAIESLNAINILVLMHSLKITVKPLKKKNLFWTFAFLSPSLFNFPILEGRPLKSFRILRRRSVYFNFPSEHIIIVMNAIFAWLSQMERSECQRFYTETLWTVRMKKKIIVYSSVYEWWERFFFFFLLSFSLIRAIVQTMFFWKWWIFARREKKMLPIELIEPEQRRENTPPMAGGEYITARAKITTALQFTVNEFGAEKWIWR